MRVWLLTADVRLSPKFGVQVTTTIPDITRSAVVTLPASTFNFSENFRGLGDTAVIAWRRMFAAPWNITFNGGVSLPTGQAEAPRFRPDLDDGSLVPVSRLQRGTGTFDPIFGVSANRIVASIFRPGIRVFATAAGRVPVAENEFGLQTGASFETGGGASREIKWHYLVGIGRLTWLHREQDTFHGTPVLVGGGDWIYLAPGVSVGIGKSTVQAEVRLPLYRSLANRQLDSGWIIQTGFVWAPF